MRRFLMCLTISVAAFLSAAWTHAEESVPLQQFSGDVDIVIRLKEPDRTMEKVVGLINKVQPGAGSQIESSQQDALGQLISNHSLTGVDQTRDWYVAVYAVKDAPPVIVFAIPVIDSKDFIGALEEGITSEAHGNWVVYTSAEALPAVDAAASLASRFDDAAEASFSEGDLKVYINTKHLSGVYEEQIKLGEDKILEGLNQLRFLPGSDTANIEQVIEFYGVVIEGLFQGISDSTTTTLGITISDSDLHFIKQVTFAEETDSANFVSTLKSGEIPLVTKLPAGAPFYFGINGAMKPLMDFSMKMTLPMLNDDEKRKQLDEQLSEMSKLDFGAFAGSMDFADSKSGSMRVAGIFEVNPTSEYKAINRKYVELTGSLKTDLFDQTATLQEDVETYGEVQGDILTIVQEFHQDEETSKLQKKTQQVLFGEGGMETRVVYLSDKVVSTLGGGKSAMQAVIKSLNSTSQKAGPLQASRSQLMPNATFLMFLDLPRVTGNVLKAVTRTEAFELPVNSQMIDSLNLKPSYIAVAVGTEGNVLTSEMRLPVEQIIGVAKLGVMMAGSMQGAGGL